MNTTLSHMKEKDMHNNSLTTFITEITAAWGPLTSELIARSRAHLEQLAATSMAEEWLASLHKKAPATAELYRDATHGFVLLAHSENAGLYRPPHDHGRGWVIYALQHGEIEMGSYVRIQDADGSIRLVQRDVTIVRPGQAMVYLPGDIHDTRCLSKSALLFRFTERDLKKEEHEAQRVTRYVQRHGKWTVATACALRTTMPELSPDHV